LTSVSSDRATLSLFGLLQFYVLDE